VTKLDGRDREVFAEYERAGLVERDDRWARIVPARFAAARIDDLDDATRSALRVGFLPRKNVVLLGPVGSGKTHAACACARQSFDVGRSVAFWPVVALMDALRPDGRARADELVAVDLLILDDLAVEKPSEWTTERLDLIVNGRWLDGRPTIVTSNLTPDVLARVVGERVWSRLVSDALVYRIPGRDRRRG
jgi:DNA replication protein DnaC